MSFFGGGVGRGRGPVAGAPNAQNRKLNQATNINPVVRSAKWGKKQAGLHEPVSINVMLHRPAINRNAKIEVMFNLPDGRSEQVGQAFTIPVAGLTANGTWRMAQPKSGDGRRGYYTFIVTIDNQESDSDELQLSNDPVASYVRRISSDGFDR